MWEKIKDAIMRKTRATPGSALKHALIDWKAVNLRAYYAEQLGGDMVCPLALALADRLPTSTATLEFIIEVGDVGSLSWRWNLPKRMCSVSIVCIVRVWCVNFLSSRMISLTCPCAHRWKTVYSLSTDHGSGCNNLVAADAKTFP